MHFPIYRRLTNKKSFYKVKSEFEFTEIQLIGNKKLIQHFTVSQYPDKLFLMEVISGNYPYEFATSNEVENLLTE
jgi:hypothetical protein